MWKRRWLFHATDFKFLMYPCFTVCRILGMFPYKINDSTFEISLPCYNLSNMVVCFYCIFYLLHIPDIINSEVIDFYDMTDLFGDVYFYTFNGLTVIVTHILSNSRMRLLQTISEIYSKLPSASHQRLSRLIHTKDIFAIIFTILEIILMFSENNIKTNWDFIVLLCPTYMNILGYQMDMLYMNCICVLKASFKQINDDLMHMQSDIINNMKLSIPNLICHIRWNQLFLMKVKTLMKQHLMISKTLQKLNLIFGLQLIATIILSIYDIVFDSYQFLYWEDGVQINFDMKGTLFGFMWLIYDILHITLIVWACETCKNQAHEIGTTVCKVHNTIRDEQIKGELRLLILIIFSCICLIWDLTFQLQLFSLQILHNKNIFSIKGFTLDATLLTSILGISTTYIFILVQFMIMLNSCNKTSVTNT